MSMLAEFRKSINSILYERVASPFYGTLLISWLVWNWKIWYLTLFIDSDQIPVNKITFITAKYIDFNFMVILPVASTIVLLTIVPFVTNGAFWLDLKFKTWRINQKQVLEGKQLLTLAQSIKLRSEIREQEENFDKLLEKKNQEIALLNEEIKRISSNKNDGPQSEPKVTAPKRKSAAIQNGSSYSGDDFYLVDRNKELKPIYMETIKYIMEEGQFPDMIKDRNREFLLINEFVQEQLNSDGRPFYVVTYKGKELYRNLFNMQHNR